MQIDNRLKHIFKTTPNIQLGEINSDVIKFSWEKVFENVEPDYFHALIWTADAPQEQFEHIQLIEQKSVFFPQENKSFMMKSYPFEKKIELSAIALKKMQNGDCFSSLPYKHYHYVSFSHPSGFCGVIAICIDRPKKYTEEFLEEISKIYTQFIKKGKSDDIVSMSSSVDSELDVLCTTYLRSIEKISADFAETLRRNTLTNLSTDYPANKDSQLFSGILQAKERSALAIQIDQYINSHFEGIAFGIFAAIDDHSHAFWLGSADADYAILDVGNKVVKDQIFADVLHAETPLLIPTNGRYSESGLQPYIDAWKSSGTCTIVGFPLKNQIGVIGCFFLCSSTLFGHFDFTLLKTFGNQVSLAYSHIGFLESVENRHTQRHSLEEIIYDFHAADSRGKISDVLESKVKDLINFSDYSIIFEQKEIREFEVFIHSGIVIDFNDFVLNVSIQELIRLYGIRPVKPGAVNSNILEFQHNGGGSIVMPQFFNNALQNGAQKVLVLSIKGNRAGYALFFGNSAAKFELLDCTLLEKLSHYLSMAVRRVIQTDLFTARAQEKDFLLGFNNDISHATNSEDLTRILSSKLKQFLDVRHFSILAVDETKRRLKKFLLYNTLPEHASELPEKFQFRPLVAESAYGDILHAESYIYVDFDKPSESNREASEFKFWKSLHLKRAVGFPLRVQGENIGVIFMGIEPHINVGLIGSQVLKDIISQISNVVAHILATETASEREAEKMKLLAFSEGINTARDRKDLALIIKPYLNTIFNIKEFIITLINNDRITYSYFLHGLQSDKPVYLGENFVKYTEVPQKGSILEQVMLSEQPVIFPVDQLIRSGALWVYVGASHAMGSRLRVGNHDIGILWIQPGQVNEFLLKGICTQIGIAVSNVMANEDLERKNNERESLLSLNSALATVRSNSELEGIVNLRVKPFLNAACILLLKINQDGFSASPYIADLGAGVNGDGHEKLLSPKYDLNDGFLDRTAISSSPVTLSLQDIRANQNVPTYVEESYNDNLKGMVSTRLLCGNKLFGFWLLFFDELVVDKDRLKLIEILTNQIGIAVSQIINNEDLRNKESEKAKLLEFSQQIGSVREKDVLANVLKTQLAKLFEIDNYIIYSISENKKRYKPLLFNEDHVYFTLPEFRNFVDFDYDVNDGVFNATLNSNRPVIHDLIEAAKNENPPHFIGIAKKANLTKIVGVTLRFGQEDIAVLMFRFTDKVANHIWGDTFSSVCTLLAMTVENLIAKEKVASQLSEIENYKEQLEEEGMYLKEELITNHNYGEIIGESPVVLETFKLITQVACSDSTVLVLGETGTGKELIARAIHNSSRRSGKLMVKVNCAALPPNLIESELFGHERGSFTGATDRRIGKFELANNGTLFLDEVGELPLELQVKLLRVLQEKEIERIGGKGTIKINVRIIAATNRDLEAEMEAGKFRSDLYYRLNIFPITLPPLRDRKEDIPLLTSHFINRYAKKTGKKINSISSKVLQELINYHWPGNIRELEHLLERSVLLSGGDTLKQVHLPKTRVRDVLEDHTMGAVIKTIDENEKEHILRMLKHCNGRIAGAGGAAQLLGIPPSTLHSKMKKLEIRRGFDV